MDGEIKDISKVVAVVQVLVLLMSVVKAEGNKTRGGKVSEEVKGEITIELYGNK